MPYGQHDCRGQDMHKTESKGNQDGKEGQGYCHMSGRCIGNWRMQKKKGKKKEGRGGRVVGKLAPPRE